jgi:hypothetical protein
MIVDLIIMQCFFPAVYLSVLAKGFIYCFADVIAIFLRFWG